MGERERKRGGRETERGREMLPLYVHFCAVALPRGRECGLMMLEMSLNGEGSSSEAGWNVFIYVHIQYSRCSCGTVMDDAAALSRKYFADPSEMQKTEYFEEIFY